MIIGLRIKFLLIPLHHFSGSWFLQMTVFCDPERSALHKYPARHNTNDYEKEKAKSPGQVL